MIVRSRPGPLEILFALNGSILPRVVGRLALTVVITVAAVMLHRERPDLPVHLAAAPFALIGLALSIFMSFRNNACYDRWWEARKLWGELIIAVRSFIRQTALLPDDRRKPMLDGVGGFVFGLAARLRDRDETDEIARWTALETAPNATDAALTSVGRQCAELLRDGLIDPIRYSVLELRLTEMSHVLAGCERIKTTPLPFAYALLLHRTAHAFCLMLPFALAPALGWWTLLLSLLVAYTFFGLDALGDELEDPFGDDPNDLPLDAMSRMLERELRHAQGQTDLPPVWPAVRDRLS
ncbi:MAG TPA: bestrophin family protein [Brevundimonas sp.]|nr:bestrophin family protein [Brevundimonas sp.]